MKPKRGWEEGHEKGETAHRHWRNILDAGSLASQSVITASYPVLLRTEKILYRFWQVGGKSPVAAFGGKNCSGMLAASLLRGLCSPGVWVPGRVYQLVMPTPSLPNSPGSKFTHEDCCKQNLEQNCSRDSEAWWGKLKNWVGQTVFATFLLSCGFGKERKLWKWIVRLGGWYWWEEMMYSGWWPRRLKNRLLC